MDTLFNPDGLVLSHQYSSTMEGTVLPYLKAHETDITILGHQDRPLFVSLFKTDGKARGTVFVVHGFTENAVKYSEIIYSLLRSGFSVVASPDVVGVEDVWAATYNYHLWKLSWAE